MIKKVKEENYDHYNTIGFEFIIDDVVVGYADVVTHFEIDPYVNYEDYDEDEEREIEYLYIERIDIEENHRSKGYGAKFIEEIQDEFGSWIDTYAAPDNKGSQRWMEEKMNAELIEDGDITNFDQGLGVYKF